MDFSIDLFNKKRIRHVFDTKENIYYVSIIDIIQLLTGSDDPVNYWRERKISLLREGANLNSICKTKRIKDFDGKMKPFDTANPESMFRIIQSIPSKNAEPIKMWLAKLGNERIEDIHDPERSLDRARDLWIKKGRSEKWIQQRMMGQEIRNKLTDYWQAHNVTKQEEYAILTNIIHEEWSGLSVSKHKKLKGLKHHNLRDHMTDAELIFAALAELSTRQIAESLNSVGLDDNKIPASKGGRIARNARLELEQKTGKKVVTNKNFLVNKAQNLLHNK